MLSSMFILSGGTVPVCGEWWSHIPAPFSSGQSGLILEALYLGQRNVFQFLPGNSPGLAGIQNPKHEQQKLGDFCG